MNPGPKTPKDLCQICGKSVRWNQQAVACDQCNKWYHVNCMQMATPVYIALSNPDASWICCSCGLTNFESSFFDSMLPVSHVEFVLATHFSWSTVEQLGQASTCEQTGSNINSCEESTFHRQEAKHTEDHTHQLSEPYV